MATTNATATATAPVLSMKLLVDTMSRRVLFAEAGKDVVEFLFSLLALPVSTAVWLLGAGSMVGSVGNLYSSVDRLDRTYVLPGASRSALLHPTAASPAAGANSSLLLPAPPQPALAKTFYMCGCYMRGPCYDYITDERGACCPICKSPMTKVVVQLPPALSGDDRAAEDAAGKGFVQGVVTYTVTDSLTVTPMSAISIITLLNSFAVTDLGALQERVVRLGYNEGLAILKASLQSKTVLTDVFLGNKAYY